LTEISGVGKKVMYVKIISHSSCIILLQWARLTVQSEIQVPPEVKVYIGAIHNITNY